MNVNYLLSSRLVRPLPPVALLGACLWALFTVSRYSPGWQPLLIEVMPLTTLAVAMLLSIRFNRSRYSLLLALVAIAGLSQTWLRGQLLPATESLLFAVLIVAEWILRKRMRLL